MTQQEYRWQVPADHPAFAGHFPGHPIVPGVVLLDQVLQRAQAERGGPAQGWQVVQAKFLSPCGPQDLLCIALREGPRGSLAFTVRTGDRDVASGSLLPPSP